ncbi:MAG: ATP-dependent sacrificial sulfur transferase LarE [Holophagales bacterium]|nr:ATP-dependent sacrificial sulfur transferase LarE [Holophagales bacterium]
MNLQTFFSDCPSVALAFSGGTDSSYLLYAGLYYGAKVKAYYVKSAFQPGFELEDARKFVAELNAEMTVLQKDLLVATEVTANTSDRCYHCKKTIFQAIQKQAAADGFTVLVDGTNASDDSGDRPGMKALAELSVRSPLRECGITKDEIRRLSEEAGLFTWNKPAYACLATRIPAGRPITKELLNKAESTENILFSMGFTDFRVRILNDSAKLQVPLEQMRAVLDNRERILQAFKPYFDAVLLDLTDR